jgi:ADP-ribose pyrophosphatase
VSGRIKPAGDDPRPAPLDASDPLREQRIDGAQVYSGALLDVRRDRARLPDGKEAVREYIVHPGAVLVVPVRDDGRLVVERQYRYPHDRAFLEFPAGKLDPGESALATGVRELAEEAGYRATVWTRLGIVHPVISYSTEAIELYAARGLVHVGASLDPGEFLEIVDCSEAELYAAIEEERITDAKTVAALALYTRWQAARARSIDVRIAGLVQGVGYRYWMIRAAQGAGLAGWVRNRRDGLVEAHVQGDAAACDRLVDACRAGPRGARVDRIDVTRASFDAALRDFDLRGSD